MGSTLLPNRNLPQTSTNLPPPSTNLPSTPGFTVAPFLLEGHTNIVSSCSFCPKEEFTLLTGSNDKTLRLWDLTDVELSTPSEPCESSWASHFDTGAITSVDWTSNGKYFAAATAEGNIIFVSERKREDRGLFLSPVQHEKSIESLKFNPAGKLLATGSADKTVMIWTLHQHKRDLKRKFKTHDGVKTVRWLNDTILASAGYGGTVYVWDVGRDVETRRYDHDPMVTETIKNEINGIAWNISKQLLASAASDRTVKIWKLSKTEEEALHTLAQHAAPVTCVDWDQKSDVLASGSLDHTIRLWDGVRGIPIAVLKQEAVVSAVAFSPKVDVLASGGSEGLVRLWDVTSTQLMYTYTFPAAAKRIGVLAWNKQGSMMIGCDGKVKLRSYSDCLFVLDFRKPKLPAKKGHQQIPSGEIERVLKRNGEELVTHSSSSITKTEVLDAQKSNGETRGETFSKKSQSATALLPPKFKKKPLAAAPHGSREGKSRGPQALKPEPPPAKKASLEAAKLALVQKQSPAPPNAAAAKYEHTAAQKTRKETKTKRGNPKTQKVAKVESKCVELVEEDSLEITCQDYDHDYDYKI